MRSDELYHHGIKGQKWGVRRYQNADGSLTSAGKKRYGNSSKKLEKLTQKAKSDKEALNDLLMEGTSSEQFTKRYLFGDRFSDKQFKVIHGVTKKEAVDKTVNTLKKRIVRDEYRRKLISGEKLTDEEAKLRKEDNIKKAIIIAGVAGISIYAAYRLSKKPVNVGTIPEQDISAGDIERVINQGFDFHRISGWKNEDFNNRLYTYVSATNTDRDIYRAWLKDFHHTGQRWESTLRAAKDIKVAGSKKQMELLGELLEQEDYFDDFSDKFLGFRYKDQESKEHFKELVKSGSDSAIPYYQKVMADISQQDSSMAKRYVDFVISKGYGALVDDNDRKRLSYTPLILLNPQDTVTQVGSKRIRNFNKTISINRLKKKGVVNQGGGTILPNRPK